jgi:myotubularin-related protein 1/2
LFIKDSQGQSSTSSTSNEPHQQHRYPHQSTSSQAGFSSDRPTNGEEVPIIGGEKLHTMSRDVTYLCPFSGPIKGNLYLTNYKLFFASKDRLNTFEVPLGVVCK